MVWSWEFEQKKYFFPIQSLEGPLDHPKLNDLVASTGNLATLPSTVVELLSLLGDATTCAEEVKRIIERDPAMTANVLKLGNSAFYGVRREISCVRDALVLMGNRSVAALSFATGMAPVLRQGLFGYGLTRDQFWNHSLTAAAAASEAIRSVGSAHLCCEAFTAGLVHDVGMLVIDPWLKQNHIVLATEGPEFGVCRFEQEKLGFDHCQAGALLARGWGFPEMLVEPIAHHHDHKYEGSMVQITRAVAAGNIMAEALDEGIESQSCPVVGECLTELGFSCDLLEKVRLDLSTNLEQTLIRATSNSPLARGMTQPNSGAHRESRGRSPHQVSHRPGQSPAQLWYSCPPAGRRPG